MSSNKNKGTGVIPIQVCWHQFNNYYIVF